MLDTRRGAENFEEGRQGPPEAVPGLISEQTPQLHIGLKRDCEGRPPDQLGRRWSVTRRNQVATVKLVASLSCSFCLTSAAMNPVDSATTSEASWK